MKFRKNLVLFKQFDLYLLHIDSMLGLFVTNASSRDFDIMEDYGSLRAHFSHDGNTELVLEEFVAIINLTLGKIEVEYFRCKGLPQSS